MASPIEEPGTMTMLLTLPAMALAVMGLCRTPRDALRHELSYVEHAVLNAARYAMFNIRRIISAWK
jgi:hypothetical protein